MGHGHPFYQNTMRFPFRPKELPIDTALGCRNEKNPSQFCLISLFMMACDPKPQDTDDPIIDTDTSNALLFESPAECQDCHHYLQFEEGRLRRCMPHPALPLLP